MAGDDRKKPAPITGGRRSGENANPYLSARRTWNDYILKTQASLRMWQLFSILALLITLASVGGVIYYSNQSKYIPYVVEVDKLGQTLVVGKVETATKQDARVIHASIAAFIANTRLVTPDIALQRKAILSVYGHITNADAATNKLYEWFNAEETNPFKRAEKETVTVDVKSVLPSNESNTSFQVRWEETIRDRKGIKIGPTQSWLALVTVYIKDPGNATIPEEQLQKNPLGIYIQDFSWSRN